MKTAKFLGAVFTLLVSIQGYAASVDEAFAKLSTLVGEWKDQKQEISSYSTTAAGFTVLEAYAGMLSLYTVDGNSIRLTHHCMVGNQPTLRAIVPEKFENKLVFTFESISGYEQKDGGYINGMIMEFIDDNHIKQIWSWYDAESNSTQTMEPFLLERK